MIGEKKMKHYINNFNAGEKIMQYPDNDVFNRTLNTLSLGVTHSEFL